jgi:undecaprenyl pyrophosphate phosphatase UppP
MPAVFVSGLLEFKESLSYLGSHNLAVLAVATAAAAVSGHAAIAFLLEISPDSYYICFHFLQNCSGGGHDYGNEVL